MFIAVTTDWQIFGDKTKSQVTENFKCCSEDFGKVAVLSF